MKEVEGVARIGALFVAALASMASTVVVAQSNSNDRSAYVQRGLSAFQPQSVPMQDCQRSAADFASHGQCGQGDLACVARLEHELKNTVEKNCVRAIEELRPKPQLYPLP
ncbi:hypothetical protein; putative exported protein [Cupriavidus metallidurans CH34]|uniref:Uncharacterized protein n=1 Tax=Cupriavidus metallidurans (strain ATCC 43123 / DSM 2839 / NBRC 102507 / CH34) TaxID=266264 RepID=Q1LJH7_CUPMC|nr:hypothetical protein; putative exported protein [Cupriavidus metallidurans CH34]